MLYYPSSALPTLVKLESNSELLTLDAIMLLLNCKYSGLDQLSWSKDDFLNCEDLSSNTYSKAKGIQFSGDTTYFYAVAVIGDNIEVAKYPRYGEKKGVQTYFQHKPLSLDEMQLLTQEITSAIEYFGLNKSFEERYQHIKSTKLKLTGILAFIEAVDIQNKLDNEAKTQLANTILDCANAPVDYFKKYELELDKYGLDEPVNKLYKYLLWAKLQSLNVACAVDHRDGFDEIPSELNLIINNLEWPSSMQYDDADTLILHASKQLKNSNVNLYNLDTESDTYLIVASKLSADAFLAVSASIKLKFNSF